MYSSLLTFLQKDVRFWFKLMVSYWQQRKETQPISMDFMHLYKDELLF